MILDKLEVLPCWVHKNEVCIAHVRLFQNLSAVLVRVMHAGFGSPIDRENVLSFEFLILFIDSLQHDFFDLLSFRSLRLLPIFL